MCHSAGHTPAQEQQPAPLRPRCLLKEFFLLEVLTQQQVKLFRRDKPRMRRAAALLERYNEELSASLRHACVFGAAHSLTSLRGLYIGAGQEMVQWLESVCLGADSEVGSEVGSVVGSVLVWSLGA